MWRLARAFSDDEIKVNKTGLQSGIELIEIRDLHH